MDEPVAYEHEYYRDTKDGNRQRCRSVTYNNWRKHADAEKDEDNVKRVEFIKTRRLRYVEEDDDGRATPPVHGGH